MSTEFAVVLHDMLTRAGAAGLVLRAEHRARVLRELSTRGGLR
jgi:hypothetical protein